MQWTDRVARRVKLRDLRVLVAVASAGSISRAAEDLAISHPVVSRTISNLEHTLGVRLFDRGSQGVEPTIFGRAFMECGIAMFDDLRSGLQRIEFLSDPTAGEVRLGSYDVMMAGFIPAIIDGLTRKHPKLIFHTIQGENRVLRMALRHREIDLVISRRMEMIHDEDLLTEALFQDPLLVVAGPRNRWSSRRKLALSKLLDERWIMPTPDSAIGALIATGFHSGGLESPRSVVLSNSIPLRNRLLATGRYLSVLPHSMLQFGDPQPRVTILPIKLPGIDQPVELVTLKGRMLSPPANIFIEFARALARSVAAQAAKN
jgi:DNA-binding transcriptional LysR family regulator